MNLKFTTKIPAKNTSQKIKGQENGAPSREGSHDVVGAVALPLGIVGLHRLRLLACVAGRQMSKHPKVVLRGVVVKRGEPLI
jgi:hypothetical protein